MSYLWPAGLAEDYRDDIEAEGSVVYVVGCEEIAGGPEGFGFFGGGDNRLGRCEAFIGSGFYFDKDNTSIGIDHNQVDFAGFAGEVAGELSESFSF